jgi:hypothetical protein
VAQQLVGLDEPAADREHAACGGMPEQVNGPFPADSGSAERATSDACHRRAGQRPVGRVERQEHLPARRPRRPPVAQVTSQRRADVPVAQRKKPQ